MAAEPVSPDVAPMIVTVSPRRLELLLEEGADQLQGDVLERQGRPVEQLQQPQPVAQVAQRGDVGVVEARVRAGHQVGQLVGLDVALDERAT